MISENLTGSTTPHFFISEWCVIQTLWMLLQKKRYPLWCWPISTNPKESNRHHFKSCCCESNQLLLISLVTKTHFSGGSVGDVSIFAQPRNISACEPLTTFCWLVHYFPVKNECRQMPIGSHFKGVIKPPSVSDSLWSSPSEIFHRNWIIWGFFFPGWPRRSSSFLLLSRIPTIFRELRETRINWVQVLKLNSFFEAKPQKWNSLLHSFGEALQPLSKEPRNV